MSRPTTTVLLMAEDAVTIRLDGDDVEVTRFAQVIQLFGQMLAEVGQTHDAAIDWLVENLEYGSAIATARPVPRNEHARELLPVMIGDLVDALVTFDGAPITTAPSKLRSAVLQLQRVAKFDSPITIEVRDVDVELRGDPVTPVVVPPQNVTSLAVLRGRIETLAHRQGPRFMLYPLKSKAAVRCDLRDGQEDLVRPAWNHVADVTGRVVRDSDTGRPLRMWDVTDVTVVDPGDPRGYRAAKGAVDSAGEPAEKIIRRIRDAS